IQDISSTTPFRDIIAWRARENVGTPGSDEMSSDRTDWFRGNLLRLPCTICEGHDDPEHLVHVELAQREDCGRRSCNIGPAGPVERLPLIGNRRFIYSVGIAYSRDIDRQTLILRRRSADDRQPDWWLIHREILIPESEDLNIP